MASVAVSVAARVTEPAPTGRPTGDAVNVRGLTKTFGDRTIVADVDLSLRYGRALALRGRNGAGKTTILRCLSGGLIPDSVAGSVGGHDLVVDGQGVRATVGLHLGDDRSWYWRLSASQNLGFFADILGVPRRKRHARIQRVLEDVQLTTAKRQRVAEFSTGMRVRLGLARALLIEPTVLMLDEPTRSLDDEASSSLASVLRTRMEAGAAVLVTTHDDHLVRVLDADSLVLGDRPGPISRDDLT